VLVVRSAVKVPRPWPPGTGRKIPVAAVERPDGLDPCSGTLDPCGAVRSRLASGERDPGGHPPDGDTVTALGA